MFAEPSGSSRKTEFEVFNFTGAGGVALAMYNTDEVDIIERVPDVFFKLLNSLSVHLLSHRCTQLTRKNGRCTSPQKTPSSKHMTEGVH